MRKKFVLLLLLLFLGNFNIAKAEERMDKPKGWFDVEKLYLEDNDYTEVNEAIKKTEDFLNNDISLPTRIPPITITHIIGSFSSKSGVPNLEIQYLDENSSNTLFKILVDKSPVPPNPSKKISTEDGNDLYYYDHSDFDVFIVEKDGLGYTFMIDKESSKKITLNGVAEIVNSMN